MKTNLPIEQLDKKNRELLKYVLKVRKKAYAPYSKYLVGSLILDGKGKKHSGCNMENASYGASICAERVAIGKMISRGSREIKKVIVMASSEIPVFPCGLCLQVIREFGKEVSIIAVNRRGTLFQEASLKELFPQGFSPDKLFG